MNKSWLALAGVVVLVVLVWFLRSGDSDPDTSAERDASPRVGQPAEESGASEQAGQQLAPSARDESDSASESATAPDNADASPFELVDDGAEEAASASSEDVSDDSFSDSNLPDPSASSEGPVSDTSSDRAPSSAANAPDGGARAAEPAASGPVVEVPESYPVTDADKYFVPAEERRPGNLGGPPPLDFPGGPSDPNRSSVDEGGTGLAPPPAPGQ